MTMTAAALGQRVFRGEVIGRVRIAHDRCEPIRRDIDPLDLIGAWAQFGENGRARCCAIKVDKGRDGRVAGLLHRTTPRSRNVGISAIEYPCSARISPLCWPKVGDGHGCGPGVPANLIGFVIVR
jgi:hypothetical protein